MRSHLVWIPLVFFCPTLALAGNVLVFPVEGSHWVNMKVILEELHSRGHRVSVVRTSDSWYIEETSPFYTAITVDMESGFDEDFITNFVTRILEIQREGRFTWDRMKLETELLTIMHVRASKVIEKIFEDASLTKALREAKYDLVLTDPCTPVGAMVSRYLGVPLVFNVRWTSHGEGHFIIAPSPLSYVPMPNLELSDKMAFLDRVLNVLVYVLSQLHVRRCVAPHYDGVMEKYVGGDVDLMSLYQGADLWLMRVDFVFEFPRPAMPNVIYMGGFQCRPAKALPRHLADFVQSSGEHGVVIMSLGSIVGQLPPGITDEIAAAFAKLPQKVVWRHKGDRPASLGNNTLLVDWMPQNDLLGHPKTKVFVAHGGTNGIQEAIYHGVPILGLPLIFDQHDNLFKMKVRGAAKILDIYRVDRVNFLQGVQEVIHQPSYRENMQRLSRLHKDQPMKPLDLALFWIEYIMRHKGASHLRSESYRMPWYSYHSIDVMVFLLGSLLISFLTFVALVKSCFRVCHRKKSKRD